jgi:hypothetical protein
LQLSSYKGVEPTNQLLTILMLVIISDLSQKSKAKLGVTDEEY